jgi:hypothetical protein
MARIGGTNGTDLSALTELVTALIALTKEQGNEISGFVPLPPDTDEHADEGMVFVPPQDLSATSPVQSVFGRTGIVTAQSGDYTVGQVTNAASVLLTLAQFAATTSAQLRGVLTDETGTGSAVFGTSPTLTTPNIASIVNTGTLTLPTSTDTLVGRATTDTLTNKTLTSPVVNTPTISGGTINNAPIGGTTPAAATFTTLTATGFVDAQNGLAVTGGFVPSQTAGIVGTTTNNNANAGSVGEYASNTGSGVALTSAVTANATSVSLTAGDWDVSGTVQFVPAGTTTIAGIASGISTTSATLGGVGSFNSTQATHTTGAAQMQSTPVLRLSLATTTTVYLVANSTFGVSTMSVNSLIRARRVR